MRRTHAVPLVMLFAGMLTCAQAQLDITITKIQPEPNGLKQATLHVQNNSGKAVAAFSVALNLKYANGKVSTSEGYLHDLGYRATKDGRRDKVGPTPKLLLAGNSCDLSIMLEKGVVEAAAKLDAVVYDDRTAEGDADAIHNIIFNRQEFAKQLAVTEPDNAAAAARFAKDDLLCGNKSCSSLRRLP